MFRRLATAALLSIAFAAHALAADGKTHRVAIQVDQNDPQVMNLALNNATNVIEYYRGKNEDVEVDIVTYGPGLHMLRSDTSPVQDPVNDHYHWHIEFMPKLTKTAGFEWGTGFYINPTPPEEAAKFLRDANVLNEEPLSSKTG